MSTTWGWQDHANCKDSGLPPEIWQPEHSSSYATALKVTAPICEPCPVRAQCLAHALAHEDLGIWAGTTPGMRKAMRKQEGAA